MIGLAAAAALAIRLAPPLDLPIRYRVIDRTPGATGDTVVTTAMTLRFHRTVDGLVAAATTDAVAIQASPPVKARLTALFGPLTGATTRAVVDIDGTVGAIVDPEPSWRAFRASQQAFLDRVEAMPAIPPAKRRLARMAVAAMLDPARRDERLRPALAQLLPPPTPPLAPGATAHVETSLAAPGGATMADSTIRCIAATEARLDFEVETIATPRAAEGGAFAETTDVAIDRHSGMLIALTSRRELRAGAAPPVPISTHAVTRLP